MSYLPSWLILSLLPLTAAMIYKLPMPDGLQAQFNGVKLIHNTSDLTGEQIFWECMQRVKWQMAELMGHNVTRETRDYLDRLLQMAVDTADVQPPRHRMEYRVMSQEARDRFHSAVRALRKDTSLRPNVYTALAELHAGEIIPMAHFGAGFLGWHRVYLLIFESALRLKDPTVSVPYWASNLDNEMEDPTKSIIWSNKFFGNGDGFVTTGPFADFRVYSTDTILTRNIGSSGSLMTNEGIHGILSQNSTEAIASPASPHAQNVELQHNMVHLWVGGDMDDLSSSAEDPVFFLHHSFIDYLWEEFRTKQKQAGIDPQTDYPTQQWGPKEHEPNAPLGFGDLRNVDSLSNVLADLVKYNPSPVCSRTHPTCGSKYLKCDTFRSPPICVSLSREEVDHKLDPDAEICIEAQLQRAIQNNFAINHYCDIRKWSYIPIKVVLQRPPEFTNYKSYPVLNNRAVTDTDVFATVPVQNVSSTLATYPKCRRTSAVARRIYTESHGLNYYGKYKDFTVLDQRHALSTATTYIGVKTPESNFTDAILVAYDYCGRTCRPFCLDVTVDPPKSRPCSGVIRITPEEPKLYGENYAQAVNSVWRSDHPDDLPEAADFNAIITFYCDYSGVWPWDRDIQKSDIQPLTSKRKQTVKKKVNKKPRGVNKRPSKSHNNRKTGSNKRRVKVAASKNPANGQTKVPRFDDVVLSQINVPRIRVVDLRSATRRPLPTNRLQQLGQRRPMNFDVNQQRRTNRPLFINQDLHSNRLSGNNNNNNNNQRGFANGRCRLNPACVLSVPCSPCQYQARQSCQVPSRLVAVCVNGIYMLESMYFNFMG